MAKLILPSEKYKQSFLEALTEFHAEGQELQYDYEKINTHFDDFLKECELRRLGLDPTKTVPDTLFWLVENGEFIGRVSLRHKLNKDLEVYGGHIGYYIRPSKRKMGYGSKALELALPEAKKLGIKKVLVTCDKGNIPSEKIIEKNGGVLQDVIETDLHPGEKIMRWWIDLTK